MRTEERLHGCRHRRLVGIGDEVDDRPPDRGAGVADSQHLDRAGVEIDNGAILGDHDRA